MTWLRNHPAAVGLFWALLAVFFWGVMFPMGRVLMEEHAIDPWALAMDRYLMATPILLCMSLRAEGVRRTFPTRAADWFALAFWGFIGCAAMALLLFIAQETISVVNSSLLESWVPIQVMVIGWCFGEKFSLRRAWSVGLGFLGTLLVLQMLTLHGFSASALRFGDLLILVSGLCWSLYTYFGHGLVQRLGALPFTTWSVFFGGLWLLAVNLVRGVDLSLPTQPLHIALLGLIVVCPTTISFFSWNEAQKTLPLSRLSFLEYLTPAVAALLGIVWPGEPVTWLQWLGMAIILLSARWL